MPDNTSVSYLPTQKMNTLPNDATNLQQMLGNQSSTVIREGSVPAEKILPSSVDTAMYMPTLPSAREPKELARELRTRCKQLGVALFFQGEKSVRSLGFTSAIAGEGKTFLAKLTAEVMAENSGIPVTLLECNWENPVLSSIYKLPPNAPGLSEWLSGECPLEAIRRPVARNLTVISAGKSIYNAPQLLHLFQEKGLQSVLPLHNEVLVIDLPATVTTAYGPLAAQLVDALLLVVRMGVTPEPFVAEACHYLKDSHVRGIVFNQVASRIPRWLQRIL